MEAKLTISRCSGKNRGATSFAHSMTSVSAGLCEFACICDSKAFGTNHIDPLPVLHSGQGTLHVGNKQGVHNEARSQLLTVCRCMHDFPDMHERTDRARTRDLACKPSFCE